jgi:hypothetical protein
VDFSESKSIWLIGNILCRVGNGLDPETNGERDKLGGLGLVRRLVAYSVPDTSSDPFESYSVRYSLIRRWMSGVKT